MSVSDKKPGMYSVKELYRIGRGPSSSHTMGPANACRRVLEEYPNADSFKVILYGSLAKTGKGHRTDYAIKKTFNSIPVDIVFDSDIDKLPHPNTLDIYAYKEDKCLCCRRVCSVGGGAVVFEGENPEESELVYKETYFKEIENVCIAQSIDLFEYALNAEGNDIVPFLTAVWDRMKKTVEAGLEADGVIPGGLNINRKASLLMEMGKGKAFGHEKEIYMISAYAYAASEENASGEMVVTAPTCGASGVLPAVLYFKQKELGYTDDEIIKALGVAGIIGNLIKTNASISGAECGCQAEIGSACAMAAAAFAYLKGLSIKQIECSAEVALEHHLGLTCDPVGGLVQIPCIERNAVAAMRAVDAVSLAEMLFAERKISLDLVIKTMYETGKDLSVRYRETSEGGLAKLYEM